MLTSKRCSPSLTEKENNARDNRPRQAAKFIFDLWVFQLKETGEASRGVWGGGGNAGVDYSWDHSESTLSSPLLNYKSSKTTISLLCDLPL